MSFEARITSSDKFWEIRHPAFDDQRGITFPPGGGEGERETEIFTLILGNT
jgi:hypothetical protein